MDTERIESLTQLSLVAAAELALVEEAEATRSYLDKLIHVRSHLRLQGKSVSLEEELSALADFVRILTVRRSDRFDYAVDKLEGPGCSYIQAGVLFGAFDDFFNDFVENSTDRSVTNFTVAGGCEGGVKFVEISAKAGERKARKRLWLSES